MHAVADVQSSGRGTSLLWINACHGWIGLQPLESPALSPYCPSLYCVCMLQTEASLLYKNTLLWHNKFYARVSLE